MGLKLTVTIVDTKGNFDTEKKVTGLDGEVVTTENLSPVDLHVGFYKDKVILLNENLYEILDDRPDLNVYELQLNELFNNCEIIHIVQYDTIGMVGYVIVDNGKKVRAKAVADGGLYLDNESPTEYEISKGQVFKTAFLNEYPKFKAKTEDDLKNKTPKEELIYLLELQNKILENNITYFNGNFDREFIHKTAIPYFIDTDWTGLTKIKYVRFPNVNYKIKNFEMSSYIKQAYWKLNH